jgi:conjugal transfer pilus assembly protein TraV
VTRTRRAFTIVLGGLAALSGGCASIMSGLGGEARYACKAPAGAQCTSVSGVYQNAIHGQLPNASLQPITPAANPPASVSLGAASAPQSAPAKDAATTSLRSPPRVLRLWIAPWEDADGDLHEASVVHVLVDTGRWLIERVVPTTRNRMDAVRPPTPAAAPALATDPASSPWTPGDLAPRLPPSPGNSTSEER